MSPLVSVVIPTYYRNKSLKDAVRSVEEQTHSPIETIVVDGSGEQHAEPVATEFECTYMAQAEDKGPHAARELGLSEAGGMYIQFLDDDDTLHPRKIEKQIERFRTTDAGVVFCGRQTESGGKTVPRAELRGDIMDRALAFDAMPCLHSTMLIKAGLLEGLYPPPHRDVGDTWLRIELAQRTTFDYVDEILVTAGEPEYSHGTTWAPIEGKHILLEEYADLYERYPTARREALADVYQKAGRRYLEDNIWSPRAIFSFAQVLRYSPDLKPIHVGEFVTSLGGRPLRMGGQFLYRALAQ